MHDSIVGKTGHYGIGVAIVLRLHEGCDCRGYFHFCVVGFSKDFLCGSPGRVEIVSGHSIAAPTYTRMTTLCQETLSNFLFLVPQVGASKSNPISWRRLMSGYGTANA